MLKILTILLFSPNFLFISSQRNCEKEDAPVTVSPFDAFVFWPNATVPFYINPDHFDKDQTLLIVRTMATFALKTCLKFAPVHVPPEYNDHVLVFVNPDGGKRCTIDTQGHSNFEPHVVHLGYDCLKSPNIEMMIMRSLGFPFEHNRMSRNVYINVLLENIEPGALELYTQDAMLPPRLRILPYDHNSVMHFGERDYSKNGHRTIIFKDPRIIQHRSGLTQLDLKKIEAVYGPVCRERERKEKIDLCQTYPGVSRRKRDVGARKSLRVNPDITPPPNITENYTSTDLMSESLLELGIKDEAQEIMEKIYKMAAKALDNSRTRYCNKSSGNITLNQKTSTTTDNKTDIESIMTSITDYVQAIVNRALNNLTDFCQNALSLPAYERAFLCPLGFPKDRPCPPRYYSTQIRGFYSTNHRPLIRQSTQVAFPGKSLRKSDNTSLTESETQSTVPHMMKRLGTTNALEKDVRSHNNTKTNDARPKRHTEPKLGTENRFGVLDSANAFSPLFASNDGTLGPFSVTTETSNVNVTLKSRRWNSDSAKRFKVERSRQKESDISNDDSKHKGLERDRDIQSNKDKTRGNEKQGPSEPANKQRNEESKEATLSKRAKYKTDFHGDTDAKQSYVYKATDTRSLPSIVRMSKLNKEFYDERKWPGGLVPYIISPLEGYDIHDMRARLNEVAEILRKRTCVRLKEINKEQAKGFEDYLVLDDSPDYVTGRVGGRQKFGVLELFEGGQHRQHAAMMVMAMLGFYFEVARHDRENYIRVHLRHVRPDKLHHFEKIREEATFDLPYDFESATHPAWQFWRKIGKTGISTVATYKEGDPDGSLMKQLGQNDNILSDMDIIKINTIYGKNCFKSSKKVSPRSSYLN